MTEDFSQPRWHRSDVPENLEPIQTSMNRGKEKCFYERGEVVHCIQRSRTKRVSYAGPSASIRIMKGVSYRVGGRSISTEKEIYRDITDIGTIYLTDKKILFMGNKNKTLKYNDIMQVYIPYTKDANVVSIVTEKGTDYFKLNGGIGAFAGYFQRASGIQITVNQNEYEKYQEGERIKQEELKLEEEKKKKKEEKKKKKLEREAYYKEHGKPWYLIVLRVLKWIGIGIVGLLFILAIIGVI